MTELPIPELLDGPWRHAVFLTYGVDIPFFENALLRQLKPMCRNKVILADGHRFLAACCHYTQPGLIRHLNRLYVADGILVPQAAHAKLILLTNDTHGRLLVGSGNLGMQGYASRGELFTLYEYGPDTEETLNAFLAVHQFLHKLIEHAWIGRPAMQRLQYLFAETPWLFKTPNGTAWPVRHNLEHSFLTQLRAAIGNKAVEELWVLSPFYDPGAVALRELLNTLQPAKTTLLVQVAHTSMDVAAVESVIKAFPGSVNVHACHRSDDNSYIHAKLYLVKTATRAICLQGSPNLSQVAMTLTPSQGNIELANFLTGERDQFDHLLTALVLGPPIHLLTELALGLTEEDETAVTDASWYLVRSELQETRLILHYRGSLPALDGAEIVIGGQAFPLDVKASTLGYLELQLNPEMLGLFERVVPVQIRWPSNVCLQDSNAIFTCHLAALQRTLDTNDEASTLSHVGSLDLDDVQFEQLLGELDAALMIDRHSVWQLVGRSAGTVTSDDEDGPYLSYAEIDYARIREHPKIQQYLGQRGSMLGYTRSRLAIILQSITDHFHGLVHPASVQPMLDSAGSAAEKELAESAEEVEQEAGERSRRRMAMQQRVRRVLINFIRRYQRGIRSRDFQEVVGSEVMITNYVIFSNLLWRLFAKDWVEHTFVLEAYLDIWQLFWGNAQNDGYVAQLPKEERAQALPLLQTYPWDVQLLAAIYYSTTIVQPTLPSTAKEQQALWLKLRDQWRILLTRSPLQITDQTLEAVWYHVASLFVYHPPRVTAIATALAGLANATMRREFLRSVEHRLQLADHTCEIKRVKVRRPALNKEEQVECLYLGKGAMLSEVNQARCLLQEWMRVEPQLDYYRIATFDDSQIAYYDTLDSRGIYWDKSASLEPHELRKLQPLSMKWDEQLEEMHLYAALLDEQMTLLFPTYLSTLKSTI